MSDIKDRIPCDHVISTCKDVLYSLCQDTSVEAMEVLQKH